MNKLINIVSNNIGKNKIKGIFYMNDIKQSYDSGVYFILHRNEIYIGKSKYLYSRLMDHKKLIISKKHTNKSFNNWDISKCQVITIVCKDIDNMERYYINKFKKNYKLINIMKPKLKENIIIEDVENNNFKNEYKYLLSKLNKFQINNFHKIIYDNYKNPYNKERHLKIKIFLLKYYIVLKDYDDIIDIYKPKYGKPTKHSVFVVFNNKLNVSLIWKAHTISKFNINLLNNLPIRNNKFEIIREGV